MTAALERALASLDADSFAPETREIRHPGTGRLCAIVHPVGVWRELDALAITLQTTPATLCGFALCEHPTIDPAEAVWAFLCSFLASRGSGLARD
jgi:hypothetical protein